MKLIAQRCVLAIGILLATAAFGGAERLFAPSSDPWPRWEQHAPDAEATVDHGAWADLLERYLLVEPDAPNRFRYAALRSADRPRLDAYLTHLQGIRISDYARAEQLAYWINLYNALTVSVVIDHYPVESIRDIDISPGLFSDGPWGEELVSVEGVALSLDDIEHRIIRPIWDDPRIHYAVNCAALGCPDLVATPYHGDEIEAQLEAGARRYVNDPRGVTIADGRVTVSKIYDWFIEDFGGSEAGVLAHLKCYAAPDLRRRLAAAGAISDAAYDWSLNDAGDPT